MSSLLDGVPDSVDESPTVLDWTLINNGLKFKTVMQAERMAYAERNNLPEPDEAEYIWISLLAYLKDFKAKQAHEAFLNAAQSSIQTQQALVEEQLAGTNLEIL
jgi:hypothetical protein